MKYKPGDKVKIRNDLVEYKQYGSCTFVPYMKNFKGEQIIKEIFNNGYTIEADAQNFKWSDEMFEDVKEDNKMDSNTLQISMKNLSEEERNMLLSLIEKANKPKSKVWKPEYGEEYYFIRNNGQICYTDWINSDVDKERFVLGNCFKTEDEAKFALEKLKVITELKRFALEHNEGEIDWSNSEQKKYYIFYSCYYNSIAADYVTFAKHNTIYFTSGEIVKQAIKEIGEDRLKKYYFEVND